MKRTYIILLIFLLTLLPSFAHADKLFTWTKSPIYNQVGYGGSTQVPQFTYLAYPEVDFVWIGDIAQKYRDGWFARMVGGFVFTKTDFSMEGYVGFGGSSKRGFHTILGGDAKYTVWYIPPLLNLHVNLTAGFITYFHDIQDSPKRVLVGFPLGINLSINPLFAGTTIGIKVETGIRYVPGIYYTRSGLTTFKWSYLMVQIIGIGVYFRSIS
ncbi:hypothetical protein KKH43_01300 [Patescibacteria group bacterium]|nr:hypothetical protein [Patescibacteria group bacterium]